MLIASHSDAHTVLKGIGLNEIWLKMANFQINEKSADGFYYGELVVDSSLIRPFYLLEIDEKTQEGIAYFKLEDKGAREIFGTIKMKKISEHEVELDFTHKQGAGVQVIECPFKLKGAFSG